MLGLLRIPKGGADQGEGTVKTLSKVSAPSQPSDTPSQQCGKQTSAFALIRHAYVTFRASYNLK